MQKKILLCWNYERKNWVSQFEEILDPGSYVFINYFSKALEKTNSTGEQVLYWNDFRSVDHLLDETGPSKVIFMGLDSPYVFLLNKACRERKIPTFFLQHGIFHSYRAYRYEEKSMRSLTAGKPGHSINNRDLPPRDNRFFWHSFKLRRLALYYRIIKFQLVKKYLHSAQRALKSVASPVLQPDHYIVYTRYLSNIFIERDGVDPGRMIEIGNEEANKLILAIQNREGYSYTSGEYYLFIDEAFTGADEFLLPPIVPTDQYNHFLLNLSAFARSKGKRLMVKLHPFSYNVDHFVKDDNIDYVRQADFETIIGNACGVFGFSSTLLIPAAFVKPACFFRLNGFSDIHKALEEMQYCKVLDFRRFSIGEIVFNEQVTAAQQAEYIRYFLYKLDDKCQQRLADIIRDK